MPDTVFPNRWTTIHESWSNTTANSRSVTANGSCRSKHGSWKRTAKTPLEEPHIQGRQGRGDGDSSISAQEKVIGPAMRSLINVLVVLALIAVVIALVVPAI